jgi:hypothetical protein
VHALLHHTHHCELRVKSFSSWSTSGSKAVPPSRNTWTDVHPVRPFEDDKDFAEEHRDWLRVFHLPSYAEPALRQAPGEGSLRHDRGQRFAGGVPGRG